MRCRNCDYTLWTIRDRSCPECGERFAPSDYDFVPERVRYCCPHCDQSYYGTDWRGHLVPRRFTCISCQHEIDMDEMVLHPVDDEPADGSTGTRTVVDAMPWFERHRRGLVRAWLATLGAGMTRPQSLIRAVPRETSVGNAFAFMAVSNLIFVGIGQVLPMAAVLLGMAIFARGGGAIAAAIFSQPTLVGVPIVIAGVVVGPVLWWLLAHGLLVITGGAGASLRRTGHAIFYSVGPSSLQAIPCDCAGMAGWIWWMISATLMVQQTHRCSGGRATFAVVLSSVLTTGLTVVLTVVLMLASYGGMQQLATPSTMMAETRTLAGSIQRYASVHGGQGPRHAAQLLGEEPAGLRPSDLVLSESATTLDQVPFADGTLDQFVTLPPNRARTETERMAVLQAQTVIAHRLGDFVFTYHGADLRSSDPQLWTVVAWPDPDVDQSLSPQAFVVVGYADGSVTRLPAPAFGQALAEQNRYRTSLDLPPLPFPSAVRHDAPALAAP